MLCPLGFSPAGFTSAPLKRTPFTKVDAELQSCSLAVGRCTSRPGFWTTMTACGAKEERGPGNFRAAVGKTVGVGVGGLEGAPVPSYAGWNVGAPDGVALGTTVGDAVGTPNLHGGIMFCTQRSNLLAANAPHFG